MARFRGTMARRGPSAMYKKRYVTFSKNLTSSVPDVIAKIVLSETGTIVAAKISLMAIGTGAGINNIMEVRLFLYCRRAQATDLAPDPTTTATGHGSIIEFPQVDTLNGFYVGSVFANEDGIDATSAMRVVQDSINEKFNFKRKCDRLSEVILSGETIIRLGSAGTVSVFGGMVLTIKTR